MDLYNIVSLVIGIAIAAIAGKGYWGKIKKYLESALKFLVDIDECIKGIKEATAELHNALEDESITKEELKEIEMKVREAISYCKPIFGYLKHYTELAERLGIKS